MKSFFVVAGLVLASVASHADEGNCQNQASAEALAVAAKTMVAEGSSVVRIKFQAEPAVLDSKIQNADGSVTEIYDNQIYVFDGSETPLRLEGRVELIDRGAVLCEMVRGSVEFGN